MSGICGFIRTGEQPLPANTLERMMHAIRRLGPDGSGCWQDQSVAFGHQMMQLTPESLHEKLPLYDDECQIALTSDARLDNRAELLRMLDLPPYSGIPDSHVLLKAYERWGKSCASRLIGEFAFAIWDSRTRSLHCFTDPMGVRPLFFTEVPGKFFAFASEVSSLLAFHERQVPLNERRLAMLGVSLLSVYLEPESTCFEGIHRVPPASVLTVGNGTQTRTEYWRPDAGRRIHFRSDDECREAFQEVFFSAVRARLRSAFPVASLLSGGLDSSGIVAAAGHLLARENKRLITLSSVPMTEYGDQVTHEREFLDLFKERANLEMHFVCAPGCGPFDELERLVQSASLCSYSYQHYLYSAFVRTARENGARIILDGHGGELSASCEPAGYMAELLLAARWRALVNELRCLDASRKVRWRAVKRHVLRPLVPYRTLRLFDRHSRFDHWVEYPIQDGFVSGVLGRDAENVKEELLQLLTERPDHRKNMIKGLLHEQRDVRQRSHAGFADYERARFSYPYFDKRVIEFCLAVDGNFKHLHGTGRRLLRLGMRGLLPGAILQRATKAPICPDYHLRYQRQVLRARQLLQEFARVGSLRAVVDFERADAALQAGTDYRVDNPMRLDYRPQFLVPSAVYLCYFLSRFQ